MSPLTQRSILLQHAEVLPRVTISPLNATSDLQSQAGRTHGSLRSPQAWVRQYVRHISTYVGTSIRPVRQFVGTSVRQVHQYVREHAPLYRGLQELRVLVGACVEKRTGHV